MSSGEGKWEPTGTPPAWTPLLRRDSSDWLSWKTFVGQAGSVNTPTGDGVGWIFKDLESFAKNEPAHLAGLMRHATC